MKIALISPVIKPISLKIGYGGIESIIILLAKGLSEKGHKIVLYAPFGSDLELPNMEIRLTTEKPVAGGDGETAADEKKLFEQIAEEQDEFDLIHSHIEPYIAKSNKGNYFSRIRCPLVVTMHNQTYIQDNINYYKKDTSLYQIHFIFISKNQAKPLNFLANQTVIYNGIDLTKINYSAEPVNNQLAFLGRITPEKGIREAIEIAKKSNCTLKIGAIIDQQQIEFYEKEIKPEIDGKQIIYLGEANHKMRNELLGSSMALANPIKWQEPFGLVMAESLAAGTPIIAPDIGSVKEIIDDGKTGFIVSNENIIGESSEKIKKIGTIDRKLCRETAEKRFNEDIMFDNYLKYYEKLTKKT